MSKTSLHKAGKAAKGTIVIASFAAPFVSRVNVGAASLLSGTIFAVKSVCTSASSAKNGVVFEWRQDKWRGDDKCILTWHFIRWQ